jgi:hypothetical protein
MEEKTLLMKLWIIQIMMIFGKKRPLPHLKNIKHAVMTVGGWFDAEDLRGLTYLQNHRKNQSES